MADHDEPTLSINRKDLAERGVEAIFEARLREALLPRFQLGEQIGRGGMGVVYRARDLASQRNADVAVKVLHASVEDNPDLVLRFRREADVLATLSHRNIVRLLAHGQLRDRPYLVLEHVPGPSLRSLARSRPLGVSRALAIVDGICAGLSHAHERGVIHRDVKPGNVLMHEAIPKLVDFGIAKWLVKRSGDVTLTVTGEAVGTPAYMAPEARAGARDADPRLDVWSTAVLLHQLVTARPPRPNEHPDLALVPDALRPVLEHALAPDPSHRIATVAELRERLRATGLLRRSLVRRLLGRG